MYCYEIHKRINQMVWMFYQISLWHRKDETNGANVQETIIKLFYSVFHLLFPISMIAGAIISDDKHESSFLIEGTLMTSVQYVKLLHMIWKQKEIIALLHRTCVYSIENEDLFRLINDKLNNFMKFVNVFFCSSCFGCVCGAIVFPLIVSGYDRKLLFSIGFPLDWKNDAIAYCIAAAFIMFQAIFSLISTLFSVIMWYLMINCAIQYEMLGILLRKLGLVREIKSRLVAVSNKRGIFKVKAQNLLFTNFNAAIQSHKAIKETTNQLQSFLHNIFLVQIFTSGVCICLPVYFVVFNVDDNLLIYMLYLLMLAYNIFDIYMVMYFANEIKLSSGRLSYCLFESNWLDQPQSCKRHIIVLTELLKQPHVLVIGKIYPLTLETFTRILNFAYSSFNLLEHLNYQ